MSKPKSFAEMRDEQAERLTYKYSDYDVSESSLADDFNDMGNWAARTLIADERFKAVESALRVSVEYLESVIDCIKLCDAEVNHHEPECCMHNELQAALHTLAELKREFGGES